MTNQRKDIAMSDVEIAEFLAEGRTLQVAFNGPDGYPDIVPMWFIYDGTTIWMRTYARSQKAVNARRDPRCCAVVEVGDRYPQLRGVQVTGRVIVSDDIDRICWVAARLLVKYEGVEAQHLPDLERAYRDQAPKQVAFELRPESIASWDHRKMSTS